MSEVRVEPILQDDELALTNALPEEVIGQAETVING
jgi:hypothetical protein